MVMGRIEADKGVGMLVRQARAGDEPRVRELADRLNDEALPAWRNPAAMPSMDKAAELFFSPPSEDYVLMVCVDDGDRPIGFAHAMMDKDFFTEEPQRHVLFIATDATHEGKGVARRLVDAVGDWARDKGATGLLLYVFATNERARAAYHRFGFREDMLKMVRPIRGT
jgi:GNAT superfamily N-acetyltransferase